LNIYVLLKESLAMWNNEQPKKIFLTWMEQQVKKILFRRRGNEQIAASLRGNAFCWSPACIQLFIGYAFDFRFFFRSMAEGSMVSM